MSQRFSVSKKELRDALWASLKPKTTVDVIKVVVEDFEDELQKLLSQRKKRLAEREDHDNQA